MFPDKENRNGENTGINKKDRRGVPLQTIIIVMVIVLVVISCVLGYFMYQTIKSYRQMREATDNYMDCQSIATDLLAGSESLTNYARGFVVTGDIQQAELYYDDTQAQNAIYEAMEEVRAYSTDERVLSQLDHAMQLRDRLSETEDYAMRLKVAAIGGDISVYPEKLQSIQLLPSDMKLSYREQDEKSRSLLFDIDYESTRNEISLRITRSMEVLIGGMLARQAESSDQMLKVLSIQHILTGALIISMLMFVLIVFTMVILPVRTAISKMGNAQRLGEEGADEIRFLARTYNHLYDQNRLSMEKLNHDATHDNLTGLYNRAAYTSMLESLAKEGREYALIVLDVDHFKLINDQFGHDTGDAVLNKVAGVISGSFRKEDMVCRIGGDEFAVIMNNIDSDSRALVCEKLRSASEKLTKPGSDLPLVTLSSGVAFTDQLTKGMDLFKSADLALYQVKKNGRDGLGFFSVDGNVELISFSEETVGEEDSE